MIERRTIIPTPLIPNHKRARAYVILLLPLLAVRMTLKCVGLFLLQIPFLAFSTQAFLLAAMDSDPTFSNESLRHEELPPPRSGERRFLLSLPDSHRNRHLRIKRDRSACSGPLKVNDIKLDSEDLSGLLRFDRSNELSLSGCLERIANPLEVVATPRVFIVSVRSIVSGRFGRMELEIVVRNTLANSASCSLTAGDSTLNFLIGPETSQAHRLLVHQNNKGSFRLPVELYKFEEVVEGAYRHVVFLDTPTAARPD
ncbi:MAG: hypothetical protein ACK555_03370 [Acidobacteriota bacterium]